MRRAERTKQTASRGQLSEATSSRAAYFSQDQQIPRRNVSQNVCGRNHAAQPTRDSTSSDESEENVPVAAPPPEHILQKRLTYIMQTPFSERGIEFDRRAHCRIYQETIRAQGWQNFIMPEDNFCLDFVRIFYANLHAAVDDKVEINGYSVCYGKESIRRIYGLEEVSQSRDWFHALQNNLTQITQSEIVYTLTLGNPPEWRVKKGVVLNTFKASSLSTEAKFWHKFVQGNLLGCRSDSEVPPYVQHLLFCILTHRSFNVGERIHHVLEDRRQKLISGKCGRTSVSFPITISKLCNLSRLPLPEHAHRVKPRHALTTDPIQGSTYAWHQQYYGARGEVGWEEPDFGGVPPPPVVADVEMGEQPDQEEQQQQPEQDEQMRTDQQHYSTDDWDPARVYAQLQSLATSLESLSMNLSANTSRLGNVESLVQLMRDEQVQFRQEYRMDQFQRRVQEQDERQRRRPDGEASSRHLFRRSSR